MVSRSGTGRIPMSPGRRRHGEERRPSVSLAVAVFSAVGAAATLALLSVICSVQLGEGRNNYGRRLFLEGSSGGHSIAIESIETATLGGAVASVIKRDRDATKNDQRPLFVMHVGIPKTASTFLQCSICGKYYPKNKNSTDPDDPMRSRNGWLYHKHLFQQDNYTYIGTCPCPGNDKINKRFVGHNHGHIFMNPTTWDPNHHGLGPSRFDENNTISSSTGAKSDLPQLRRAFKQQCRNAYNKGQNALFIFEGCHKFDPPHVAALKEFLTEKLGFQVHVVVAYRRLYEWLPSKYNSITKPKRNKAVENWPGFVHVDRDGSMRQSTKLQPFHLNFGDDETADSFDQLVEELATTLEHPTQTVRDNYARYFDHVHVVPLHLLPNEDDLPFPTDTDVSTLATRAPIRSPYLYHLFCVTLFETTPHICQAVATGTFRLSKSDNPSQPLDYDRIAVAAHERGWIPSVASRSKVAAQVEGHFNVLRTQHETESRSYPEECLPQASLDRLLEMSLTMEMKLFGHELASQWDDHHRQAFETYKRKSKYCWLDTKKLLREDQDWISFLQQLGKDYAMKEAQKAVGVEVTNGTSADNEGEAIPPSFDNNDEAARVER